MITPAQEYNELLYAVEDINSKNLVPVKLRKDDDDYPGYPDILDYRLYYYKEILIENEEERVNYIKFVGSIKDMVKKWPNASDVPTFYEPENRYHYRIPPGEQVYKIDLDSRDIEAPKFLSVFMDNDAEVIWFSVDRFHDDVDLYGATCYILYKNALNEQFVCVTVPQVIPESNHDKMYIPWPVGISATKAAGKVTFSFQFFKLSEDEQTVYYSINTKPATSQVLNGLHVDPVDDFIEYDSNINPQYSEFLTTFNKLATDYSTLSKDYNLYWLEM